MLSTLLRLVSTISSMVDTMLFDQMLDERTSLIEKVRCNKNAIAIVVYSIGVMLSVSSVIWMLTIEQEMGVVPNCEETQLTQELVSSASAKLIVDIRGEVKNPGIYSVEDGSRLGEVVEKAGGLTTEAHPSYVLHKLNFAQKVVDSEKIYVPHQKETEFCESVPSVANNEMLTVSNSTTTSLNSATQSQLESLAGIGEKRAQDIIANRPYESIEELVSKKIISQTLFEELESNLSL